MLGQLFIYIRIIVCLGTFRLRFNYINVTEVIYYIFLLYKIYKNSLATRFKYFPWGNNDTSVKITLNAPCISLLRYFLLQNMSCNYLSYICNLFKQNHGNPKNIFFIFSIAILGYFKSNYYYLIFAPLGYVKDILGKL